jgi:hypothetical protein
MLRGNLRLLATIHETGSSNSWNSSAWTENIGCPTLDVAKANLTIKINFNILRPFSSSDTLTIYLHAFLQSLNPFEKNCGQGLPRDFRQNNPNRTRSSEGVSARYSIGFPLT